MTLLFWVTTLLPGMALMSRCRFRGARLCLLGSLAWAFVLSCFVFTLLAGLAFALRLAAPTAAALYGVTVSCAAGVLIVQYRRARGRTGSRIARPSSVMWLALAVVVVVALLPGAARFDAQMHAAKILQILEVGFTLQDPYSPQPIWMSAFTVNLVHFYHVVGAQLTGQHPLEFWYESTRFFSPVAFGAVEVLALAIFGRQWLAGLAMIGAAPFIGGTGDTAVPGTVANWILLPLFFVQVMRVLEGRRGIEKARLAMIGAVAGAVHVGHWTMWLLCFAPALLAIAAWRREAGLLRAAFAALTAGFAPGAPLVMLTLSLPNHAIAILGPQFQWELSTHFVAGWRLQLLSVTSSLWIVPTFSMALLVAAAMRHGRSRLVLVVATFVASLFYMYNPIVFALVTPVVPYWMLRRMAIVAMLLACLALPAGLGWLARRSLTNERRRLGFAVSVLLAGLVVLQPQVRARVQRVRLDREALQQAAELRRVLAPIRGRPLIAADRELSLLIPAVKRAAVMAPSLGNANPADGNILARAAACDELLDPKTSPARRGVIVEQYGIDWIVERAGPTFRVRAAREPGPPGSMN